jgi:hypothetical protein
MIVVGLDVHKHSLTAVAVDELGRALAARSGPVDAQILEWASGLEAERLWALEDCRHVTRTLERELLRAGERLVRVPPRLTAPQRRRSRTRGKSDAIDALAIARAALQEPSLEGPRADEEPLRELKLLVDHRDDLVDERRRCQQRLRWHLHELDPALHLPLGALDRAVWLDRLSRKLARHEQTVQLGIARELVARCRTLTRRSSRSTANSNNGRRRSRHGCCSCPAADPSARRNCSARSGRSSASEATHNSPVTPASRHSTPAQASTSATDSTAAATGNSTARCTGSRSRKAASTGQRRLISNASKVKARAAAKRSAASNDNSPAPSTQPSKPSQH